MPGSSSPMWVYIVLHDASAMEPAAISRNLEDMAVILLETDGLLLRHSAGRAGRRWGRCHRRRHERASSGRDTRVGAAVDQQVGLVRGPDASDGILERAC